MKKAASKGPVQMTRRRLGPSQMTSLKALDTKTTMNLPKTDVKSWIKAIMIRVQRGREGEKKQSLMMIKYLYTFVAVSSEISVPFWSLLALIQDMKLTRTHWKCHLVLSIIDSETFVLLGILMFPGSQGAATKLFFLFPLVTKWCSHVTSCGMTFT